MAQIDLGKLKFNFMGEWNNSTAYKKDDVVYHEGSTYVYRSDVNANGGTPPANTHLGSVCDLMALGINYRGAWQSGTTYFKGDLVDWQNAKYLFIGTGNNNVNTFSPTAAGYTSLWSVFIPANPADVLTTSGDLLMRENDGVAIVRLPIGKKGQSITVIEKPDQDIPNDKNFDYAPFTGNGDALGSGMVRWLLGDERETYESITYTVTVATGASGTNQFHISGGSLSGTVERPTLDIKIGSQYIFDVSDASNTGHVFAFRHWTGSSYPEVAVEAEMGITRSGTAGQAGATVTWVPTPASQYVLRYFCSVHSSMSDGIFATNFTRGQQFPKIYRSPTQTTAVKLSKGKTYSFTFPANQRTYSIKDTADSNYNPTLTGGRYEKGVSPTSITNGGTISFTVPDDAPQTLSLEDQNGGGDALTFSIKDRAFVPSYGGGDFSEKSVLSSVKENYQQNTAGILQFNNFPNQAGNVYTESIKALPDYLKKVGRGYVYGCNSGFYRQGGYIGKRETHLWGNFYHDGNDYVYGGGVGLDGQNATNGSRWHPNKGSKVQGYKLRQALAGNPDYAHLLTDLLGNNCDMLDDNGNIVHRFPKVLSVHGNRAIKYHLCENGMVWFSGYNGYGLMGDGGTRDRNEVQAPMKWYDESTSELKGTNFPKIKQIVTTHAHTMDTNSNDYGSSYAVDTNGFLYSWGYNGYGQLGDGTNNGNNYAKRVPASAFNNEKVLYVTCSGYRYTHVMVITESGKCWATGYGDQGQLGLNNTSSRNEFAEVTAVSGSPLNGKKILHIIMNQDGDAEGRTWWLTEDGKVYYAGYFRDYGQQTGVYDSSGSGGNGMPRILTNSSSLWNSDDQKVIYMVCTNVRYSTLWFITDGGSTGMEQKIYSTASNYYGIQGTNNSPNSHTNSPSLGGWFGGEILFSDFGDFEDGGDNSRPNEAIGNWSSFQDGGSNEKKMKIGKIIEIIPRGTPENTYNSVVLLDEFGSLFFAGYWNYTPSRSNENDGQHYLRYQDHWVPYFIHWPDQPAQCMENGFCHLGYGTENGWFWLSRFGDVYTGGDNSWYQQSDYNSSGYDCGFPSWTTLDTNG